MEQVYGTTERHDNLILIGKRKAVLIFGYGEDDMGGYDYRHVFNHKPSKEELIDVITTHVNSLTDEKILSGFVWNGINVWLSTENQFNFKAAFDVSAQTNGAWLPIKFKLGERNGEPVYHIFDTMDGFTDFYTKAMAYIMQTLNEGWEEKDNARQWVESLDL